MAGPAEGILSHPLGEIRGIDVNRNLAPCGPGSRIRGERSPENASIAPSGCRSSAMLKRVESNVVGCGDARSLGTYFASAMHSISTKQSFGRRETSTVLRAGRCSPKKAA